MVPWIVVRNILIRSLSVEHAEVSWEVAPTREDVLDYTFQVLRSEGPAGPFEPISPAMEDRYFFIDNRVKVKNKFRQWFYTIRCTHKQSGEYKDYGPESPGPPPDLVANEIRTHINLLMREFVGRRCWVFPVRTFGQRCPNCFNEALKARTKSGCRTCYDTGFVRGYLTPIEGWMQIDAPPNQNQQTNIGELQQQNTTARMGFYPPLKPKDLIIEPDNVRWRVSQATATQRLRAVVHQEIQLHHIPATDVEYLIDFDFSSGAVRGGEEPIKLQDLFLAGARNFTNPQNLEAFENDEMPGIFSLYETTYPPVTK